MKIRNGFVSNSSSSSFVITAKAEKGMITIPAGALGQVIDSKAKLDHYFKDNYDEESIGKSDNYKSMLKSIDKGEVIIITSVDNNGVEFFQELLDRAKLKYESD